MRIGIVGVGVVGTAIKRGFEELDHEVKIHDTKLNTSLDDILDTEIVYLCLPTNPAEDGSCDISSIISTIKVLSQKDYKGIVVVKSTVIPGTYRILQELFDNDRLCFVPEFLREKFAYDDFTKNHNVLVIGAPNDVCIEKIIQCHGKYPKNTHIMKPEEAEFVKYFSNVFKAVKITFANSLGTICKNFGVDYNTVLKAYELENVKETSYLKYFEKGGFAGMCLPKDVKALSKLAENHNVGLFKFILNENQKFL